MHLFLVGKHEVDSASACAYPFGREVTLWSRTCFDGDSYLLVGTTLWSEMIDDSVVSILDANMQIHAQNEKLCQSVTRSSKWFVVRVI